MNVYQMLPIYPIYVTLTYLIKAPVELMARTIFTILELNWQDDEKDLFRTTETNNILHTKVEEIISSKD
jgi:hypothetical protein